MFITIHEKGNRSYTYDYVTKIKKDNNRLWISTEDNFTTSINLNDIVKIEVEFESEEE